MATPQAAVAMISQAILTTIAFFIPNLRCIFWIFGALMGLVGAVMVHSLNVATQRDASLAGVYLMGFYNVPWVFLLSLSSSNTAGATKKSFMGISIAIVYGMHSPTLILKRVRSLTNDLQLLATLSVPNSSSIGKHQHMLSVSALCFAHLP
jgi:hypothetical protein